MKKTRKWLSAALALVMVLLLAPAVLPTAEATSTGNVSITADTSAKVGDTVTVTLSNKEMTVSAFTCGLSFDTAQLQCTEIGTIDSHVTNEAKLIEPQLTTLNPEDVEQHIDANSIGRVGFGVVYVDATSLNDKTVVAGDFLTVKFKVKVAGEITISAYEDSAGTNGHPSTSTELQIVDSVKITATAAGGLLGDVNNDGDIDGADAQEIMRYAAGLGSTYSTRPDFKACADVNGDGDIDGADAQEIMRYAAGLGSTYLN